MSFRRTKPDPFRPRLWIYVCIYAAVLAELVFISGFSLYRLPEPPYLLLVSIPLSIVTIRVLVRELRRPG